MRARGLGLDQPDIRVPAARSGIAPGDTFALSLRLHDAGYCLAVGEHEHCGPGFNAAETWALLLYPVPRPLGSLLRYLWPTALFIPAGFWLRRTGVALVAAAGLLAVCATVGGPGPPGLGSLAGAVGLLAGAAAPRCHRLTGSVSVSSTGM
jgi:hypothetical protein